MSRLGSLAIALTHLASHSSLCGRQGSPLHGVTQSGRSQPTPSSSQFSEAKSLAEALVCGLPGECWLTGPPHSDSTSSIPESLAHRARLSVLLCNVRLCLICTDASARHCRYDFYALRRPVIGTWYGGDKGNHADWKMAGGEVTCCLCSYLFSSPIPIAMPSPAREVVSLWCFIFSCAASHAHTYLLTWIDLCTTGRALTRFPRICRFLVLNSCACRTHAGFGQ